MYKFPKDMNDNIQPYMVFNAFSWTMRGKKTQDVSTNKQTQDSIVLPMSTNGIIDSINNNWESGVGLGAEGFTDALKTNILGKTVDAFGDLAKFYGAKRGELVNDYASFAFTGTEFRTFEFNFTLIPKNKSEANTILEIVKAFKRNSLPHYEKYKISYPNYWDILIKLPNSTEIIKIKSCVLNTFTSTTFADGVPSIYTDGNPQKVDITLSFTEIEKIDRNDYL